MKENIKTLFCNESVEFNKLMKTNGSEAILLVYNDIIPVLNFKYKLNKINLEQFNKKFKKN